MQCWACEQHGFDPFEKLYEFFLVCTTCSIVPLTPFFDSFLKLSGHQSPNWSIIIFCVVWVLPSLHLSSTNVRSYSSRLLNLTGLAPYVADLTALFRSDWHPASHAWLMRTEVLQDTGLLELGLVETGLECGGKSMENGQGK